MVEKNNLVLQKVQVAVVKKKKIARAAIATLSCRVHHFLMFLGEEVSFPYLWVDLSKHPLEGMEWNILARSEIKTLHAVKLE